MKKQQFCIDWYLFGLLNHRKILDRYRIIFDVTMRPTIIDSSKMDNTCLSQL